MRTDMVIDALNMAAWNRGGLDLEGLRAHSDAGSQFTSILWGEQLAQLGAAPSIGTVDEVELATLTWVHCDRDDVGPGNRAVTDRSCYLLRCR